jgi:hypothetical protein
MIRSPVIGGDSRILVSFESFEEITIVPYSITNVEIDSVERTCPFPGLRVGRCNESTGSWHDLHQSPSPYMAGGFFLAMRLGNDKSQSPEDIHALSI